jgi:hypothetical protein
MLVGSVFFFKRNKKKTNKDIFFSFPIIKARRDSGCNLIK